MWKRIAPLCHSRIGLPSRERTERTERTLSATTLPEQCRDTRDPDNHLCVRRQRTIRHTSFAINRSLQ